MPEEKQFHMTVVTQKRVPRSGAEQSDASGRRHRSSKEHEHRSAEEHEHRSAEEHEQRSAEAAQPDREAPAEGSRSGHSSGRERGRSHRRYRDYGTVELGSLDDRSPEREAAQQASESEPAAPSKGQLQREFYDKYDAALRRRYTTRNRGKVARIAVIALLAALIIIASLIWVGNLREQTAETLEKPDLETIPVVTMDLG